MSANPNPIVSHFGPVFDSRHAMGSNSIFDEFTSICQELYAKVASAAPGITAPEMETQVFAHVLQIGLIAMKQFFAAQAPYFRQSSVFDAQGRNLFYHGERTGQFPSIFGKVEFARSYYRGEGHGYYPMDAALNLPLTGASDLVRQMHDLLAMHMSYEESASFVARFFPVSRSSRAVQEQVRTDSADVKQFYEQYDQAMGSGKQAPTVSQEATILAAQADGKGVPMVLETNRDEAQEAQPGRARPAPHRDGKKKEATVVSVSTHVPFARTPEQIVASLFADPVGTRNPNDAQDRPDENRQDISAHEPRWQRVWATMEGKSVALSQARQWADHADGDHIQARVTLTDGLPALQNRVDDAFPEYVRVLDLMHALGYLWKAADAQFGAKSAPCRSWVRGAVLRILRGQATRVVEELDDWAAQTRLASKYEPIEQAATYFEKNLAVMQYDKYLAAGWPIATGIIEGACRHVVKDRCERSGMRWTMAGVEAVLHLRCVHQNGDWDAYHAFRISVRQQLRGGTQATGISDARKSVLNFNIEREWSQAA